MNKDIAEVLKSKLLTAEYAERIAGLTRPVEVKIRDVSGSYQVRRVPMGCDVTNPETCPPNKMLIPDSRLSSIVWFEDGGVIMQEQQGRYFNFISELRLIVWLNLNFFEHDCTISPAVEMDIVKRLSFNFENTANYQGIKVTGISFKPKDVSVFAQYSFENVNLYTMYPYDFLSATITTMFSINSNCKLPITRKDVECTVNTI
jgi:hypothetical protein